MLTVLDLFSGIGGFTLGLESTGHFKTIGFCENNPYCQRVLAKHWPSIPIHQDVIELRGEDIGAANVITGGFPCQDLSHAGDQEGIEGARSGLWSQFDRIIGEVQPEYVVIENVAVLLFGRGGRWFERVLWDLFKRGYDAQWICLRASDFGALHKRDRVWIIAYPYIEGSQGRLLYQGAGPEGWEVPSFGSATQRSDRRDRSGAGRWDAEPVVGRVADGIPDRSHRLRGLGNSVVPQIPAWLGELIALDYSRNQ